MYVLCVQNCVLQLLTSRHSVLLPPSAIPSFPASSTPQSTPGSTPGYPRLPYLRNSTPLWVPRSSFHAPRPLAAQWRRNGGAMTRCVHLSLFPSCSLCLPIVRHPSIYASSARPLRLPCLPCLPPTPTPTYPALASLAANLPGSTLGDARGEAGEGGCPPREGEVREGGGEKGEGQRRRAIPASAPKEGR